MRLSLYGRTDSGLPCVLHCDVDAPPGVALGLAANRAAQQGPWLGLDGWPLPETERINVVGVLPTDAETPIWANGRWSAWPER